MTTITLEISDEQAQQLANDAEQMHLPVQELAISRIFQPWHSVSASSQDGDFEAAMEYVFHKNTELYRRLA